MIGKKDACTLCHSSAEQGSLLDCIKSRMTICLS